MQQFDGYNFEPIATPLDDDCPKCGYGYVELIEKEMGRPYAHCPKCSWEVGLWRP